MEKKQTAVEWLLQRFEDGDMYNVEDVQFIKHQAKEMEKEQIINAHLIGLITSMEMEATKQAEQYYNETYKTI